MHIVGNYKNRKGGIAWIFPPRTGTRYTKELIRKHGWFIGECGHHQIIPDRLEGHHQLLCNVRNPYTRVQSWWKHLSPTLNMDLESYILRLDEIDYNKISPKKVEPVIFLKRNSPVSYLQPITGFLLDNNISLNRIDKYIKMESFDADLLSVGFLPDIENRWTSVNQHVQIDWFYDKPKCIKIVNKLYDQDFKNFGYNKLMGL